MINTLYLWYSWSYIWMVNYFSSSYIPPPSDLFWAYNNYWNMYLTLKVPHLGLFWCRWIVETKTILSRVRGILQPRNIRLIVDNIVPLNPCILVLGIWVDCFRPLVLAFDIFMETWYSSRCTIWYCSLVYSNNNSYFMVIKPLIKMYLIKLCSC